MHCLEDKKVDQRNAVFNMQINKSMPKDTKSKYFDFKNERWTGEERDLAKWWKATKGTNDEIELRTGTDLFGRVLKGKRIELSNL